MVREDVEKKLVRLPTEDVLLLQHLVDTGEFNSISDAILEAVYEFLESRIPKEERDKVLAAIDKKDIQIKELMDKNAKSVDDIVRDAVSEYVDSHMPPGG